MQQLFRDYIQRLKDALDGLDWRVFEQVVRQILRCLEEDRQIFTMGNGGSGVTASHLACDLNKGVVHPSGKRFRAICLNDNLPTLMAYANDVCYSEVFREPLKNFLRPGDLVIVFSGSGNSENVLNAVDYARSRDAVTVGFSGFDGGRLAHRVDYSVVVPVEDMQKSEDGHLILAHIIMQTLNA